MFGWLLKGKSKHQDRELIRESSDFIEGLPSVDLGKPLDREAPYLGKEKVFYQFYVNVIGESAASEILKQHGFERSALFGLHFAATKIATIPKVKLMDLADGDRELIGFGFQPPTKCNSWAIPFEHYKAELFLGRAITEPVKHQVTQESTNTRLEQAQEMISCFAIFLLLRIRRT